MNPAIGILVIGTEILLGKREDRHFVRSRQQLRDRGYEAAWCLILPDRREEMVQQLRWAFHQDSPFFSFGGLGTTPDDLTRGCAAEAAGVPLVRHAYAEKLIREHFGSEAEPVRIRMADLPETSTTIPNPINQVPGFQLENGFFFPGFPEMAAPMATWVLEQHFPRREIPSQGRILLDGVRESQLVNLMENFCTSHPAVEFSSLPSMKNDTYQVELGLRGMPGVLLPAWADLLAGLEDCGYFPGILESPSF